MTSQEGDPPASEEVCVCVCVFFCLRTHPPKVLPVGVFGHAVGRVYLAHQGSEASSFGDVLPAAHTDNLHRNTHRLHKRSKGGLKCVMCAAFKVSGEWVKSNVHAFNDRMIDRYGNMMLSR